MVGYAMIQYETANQAAVAIYRMHGQCVGDREPEVTLMHREIAGSSSRGRFGLRFGNDVWNIGD